MAYGFLPFNMTAATYTLNRDTHANGVALRFNSLTGVTATLPAAAGTGDKYFFQVFLLATSNSYIVKVANASDYMMGVILGSRTDSGNAVLGFAAANSGTVATNSDTITLNRTTTGSVNVGEWIECWDAATNVWQVRGVLSATGAAFATPFTAGV